jgi:hypothetical protein
MLLLLLAGCRRFRRALHLLRFSKLLLLRLM